MFNVMKAFNGETLLAEQNGILYILKRIALDDIPLIRRLMSVKHPNIVSFYDTVTLDGKFYAVEEYVNGVTLEAYVQNKGVLSEEETARIILSVCSGLSVLHKAGIVHRDINPSNIMLDGYGNVKIIDFGISRLPTSPKPNDTHILGTEGYAAPEQFGFSETTAQSDIYAVGVLMNYLLTGTLPKYRLPKSYLASVILGCTEVDVAKRYADADELMYVIRHGGKRTNVIRNIPGFRKNIAWHKVVAVPYYLCLILLCVCSLTLKKDPVYNLCAFFYFFFSMGVAPMVAVDVFDWSKKWRFTARMTVQHRRWWRAAFTVLSIMISVVFIILLPTE